MSLSIEVAIFTGFGFMLSAIVWWTWQQRQQARAQAELNATLATLGKEVQAIAHDMSNIVGVVLTDAEAALMAPPEDLREALEAVERGAQSASSLAKALKGRPATSDELRSAEGLVRKSVALMRSSARIALSVDGDMQFRGDELDVLRLVHNLLVNAAEETRQFEKSIVKVDLEEGVLRVSNQVRDPGKLDESMFLEGKSGRGSTGLGLSIARDAAGRVGWGLRFEVAGDRVTFIVEEQPEEQPEEKPQQRPVLRAIGPK